jgi:hypothetical protein
VYEDEYSTKSDVYSFAVVMWEIFNQGELPFPKMNDTSFLNKLKEKKLEWKPHPSTPESLQTLEVSLRCSGCCGMQVDFVADVLLGRESAKQADFLRVSERNRRST